MKSNNISYKLPIQKLKNKVSCGETLHFNWRINQIDKVNNLIDNYRLEIINSLNLDLGKSKIEALSEIILIKEEIKLIKKNLKDWMKPQRVKTPFYLFPSFSKIISEPLGCVLILGPYNYPLLYIFKPLVNIFSAGNTAIIKPSEKCPNVSKLIKRLTDKYFQSDTLFTIEGDYKESKKLVSENFDHIFFTGSSKTGKSIMKLAAENLTPLTLELSGTNPVIILNNTNLKVASKRIVWGKFFNSGQSCIAPNHIFVERSIEEKFINELKKTIISFYGEEAINADDLSKLEKSQFFKTKKILKEYQLEKRIIFGGNYDEDSYKVSPTIIKVKDEKDPLVRDEIFSSLLPIISIDHYEEALNIIQSSSKPLAIYIFGGEEKIHQKISDMTSSGSICINDVMLPVLIPNLPFGGVGKSGMGKFHGEMGFKNFSNQKSIIKKSPILDINLRYPPYEKILKFIKIFFQI